MIQINETLCRQLWCHSRWHCWQLSVINQSQFGSHIVTVGDVSNWHTAATQSQFMLTATECSRNGVTACDVSDRHTAASQWHFVSIATVSQPAMLTSTITVCINNDSVTAIMSQLVMSVTDRLPSVNHSLCLQPQCHSVSKWCQQPTHHRQSMTFCANSHAVKLMMSAADTSSPINDIRVDSHGFTASNVDINCQQWINHSLYRQRRCHSRQCRQLSQNDVQVGPVGDLG